MAATPIPAANTNSRTRIPPTSTVLSWEPNSEIAKFFNGGGVIAARLGDDGELLQYLEAMGKSMRLDTRSVLANPNHFLILHYKRCDEDMMPSRTVATRSAYAAIRASCVTMTTVTPC